jgi:glycosyltransferase involved in cell wall biosynthesis
MLRHLDSSFMVPAGNVEQFSGQLVRLLKLNLAAYSQLSQQCIDLANSFSWSKIAKETLAVYSNFLRVET